jgi:hypothetical protein
MKTILTLVKLHNYTYYHGFKSLMIAGMVILSVITFVFIACPALGANILHDLLTRK